MQGGPTLLGPFHRSTLLLIVLGGWFALEASAASDTCHMSKRNRRESEDPSPSLPLPPERRNGRQGQCRSHRLQVRHGLRRSRRGTLPHKLHRSLARISRSNPYVINQGPCVECAPHELCPGPDPSTRSCFAGTFASAQGGVHVCEPCVPGSFCPGGLAPTSSCPANTTSRSSAVDIAQCECKAGFTGNASVQSHPRLIPNRPHPRSGVHAHCSHGPWSTCVSGVSSAQRCTRPVREGRT